jgi:hypothetical protein
VLPQELILQTNGVVIMELSKVFEIVSPVLLAALSWLSLQIARFINARARSERLRALLERLDHAVFIAVREVEQVVVGALKNGHPTGLSDADRHRAKSAALAAVKAYLGLRGLSELGKVLGLSGDELDRMLDARVEAAVYDLHAPSNVLNQALARLTALAPAGSFGPIQ